MKPAAARPAEPHLTIAYPLDGDRFMLEPQMESKAIPLKAIARCLSGRLPGSWTAGRQPRSGRLMKPPWN